jgi:nucleoside-diphosphate-sugar epimerase
LPGNGTIVVSSAPARLLMLPAQTSPTVVFHTVSPSVKNKGLKETAYYDVNVDGTRRVLNACQRCPLTIYGLGASGLSGNVSPFTHSMFLESIEPWESH